MTFQKPSFTVGEGTKMLVRASLFFMVICGLVVMLLSLLNGTAVNFWGIVLGFVTAFCCAVLGQFFEQPIWYVQNPPKRVFWSVRFIALESFLGVCALFLGGEMSRIMGMLTFLTVAWLFAVSLYFFWFIDQLRIPNAEGE